MFHLPAIPSADKVGTSFIEDEHNYIVPTKGVKGPEDMAIWEKSEAYFEYLGFILALNEAVKGKANSLGKLPLSQTVENVIILLNKLDTMIDEIPPIQQPQRFGNQAFRTWYAKLKDQAIYLVQEALPERLHRAVPEIMYYLIEGFGNATRIDYGTGHEMSFIMFLCCLFKIGAFIDSDRALVPCKIFSRYLEVVRKLQQTYRMEPAGSHGVWSLDDYQFVPFIWGSSQLVAHPRIEPASFLHEDIIETYANEYLFLGCIKYINKVKIGPFAEHSNQLWGISGVSNWSKVNGGLIKMYKAEVLAKFPVVQHILFGSLLPLKIAKASATIRKTRMSLTPPSSTMSHIISPCDSNDNSKLQGLDSKASKEKLLEGGEETSNNVALKQTSTPENK